MKWAFGVALFLAASVVTSANAGSNDTLLFEKGYWSVVHVAFDDGSQSCKMVSLTPRSAMILWADTDGLTFHVANDDWNLDERTARIYVDVDYDRFDGRATLSGRSMFVFGLSQDFIVALARGNAVALFNDRGHRLLTYSLRGSAAATYALMDCWGKIMPSSDPFGSAIGVSDPF
jgi:hypothetical protein